MSGFPFVFRLVPVDVGVVPSDKSQVPVQLAFRKEFRVAVEGSRPFYRRELGFEPSGRVLHAGKVGARLRLAAEAALDDVTLRVSVNRVSGRDAKRQFVAESRDDDRPLAAGVARPAAELLRPSGPTSMMRCFRARTRAIASILCM